MQNTLHAGLLEESECVNNKLLINIDNTHTDMLTTECQLHRTSAT